MAGTLKGLATALIFLLAPFFLLAQEISDFTYRLVEGNIEISYTLDGQSSDRFVVKLYSSLDGFNEPLKLVSGDIGADISPGTGKKVIWDGKAELGEFKGSLSLRLKTRLIPFISFTLEEGRKIKMGKTNVIGWRGEAQNLKLELYSGDKKVGDIGQAKTGSTYNWQIPKKSYDKGENYRIRGTANGRETYSSVFKLSNKLPVYIYIIPVAVIGGVVAIIASSGTGSEEGNNDIPEPVGPN